MSRRREGIVSLTQTEIMLVLAVVILILLIAKNGELLAASGELAAKNETLAAVCERNPEQAECLVLANSTPSSESSPTEPSAEIDESAPVPANLEPGPNSPAEQYEQLAAVLELESDASFEQVRETVKEVAETDAVVRDELKLGSDASPEQVRETVKKTAETDAVVRDELKLHSDASPEQIRETLGDIKQKAGLTDDDAQTSRQEADAQAERLKEDMESVRTALGLDDSESSEAITATIDNLQQKLAEATAEAKKLRAEKAGDKVGFNPCWPGPRLAGEEGKYYYSAFDLTYYPADRQFKIAPHKDLQSAVAVVQNALGGELRVIKNYPKGKITREAFQAFAGKINAAKNRQYHGNKAQADCLLAATINETATNRENKFILKAGFYPISR